MGFDVLPVTKSPLGKFWQPKLEFTGGILLLLLVSIALLIREQSMQCNSLRMLFGPRKIVNWVKALQGQPYMA
jgi:hypothetical protein